MWELVVESGWLTWLRAQWMDHIGVAGNTGLDAQGGA